MRVTADTITDEQLRELQKTLHPGEWGHAFCTWALNKPAMPHASASWRNARARCAEILNARAEAK